MKLTDAMRQTVRPLRLPRLRLDLDDAGALAIMLGALGGCALVGFVVAWTAGAGLLCAVLVVWGSRAVQASKRL